MNIKQGRIKKASWTGGLHRKVHTRVWTTSCQAYEPLFFSVTAVMASMWPLLATPSSASMTPHDIITHHTTAHDITTAERLKAGWHKKLWRTQCDTSTPKLKWPVWHYHAQIAVLASTLSNLLSNKHTGYERSTCLSSSKPVQTRIKILSSQAKNTDLLNFHIASPKILRRLLGKTPVMLLSRKCTMLTTSKYSNKKQKNRKKGRIAPSLSW